MYHFTSDLYGHACSCKNRILSIWVTILVLCLQWPVCHLECLTHLEIINTKKLIWRSLVSYSNVWCLWTIVKQFYLLYVLCFWDQPQAPRTLSMKDGWMGDLTSMYTVLISVLFLALKVQCYVRHIVNNRQKDNVRNSQNNVSHNLYCRIWGRPLTLFKKYKSFL